MSTNLMFSQPNGEVTHSIIIGMRVDLISPAQFAKNQNIPISF